MPEAKLALLGLGQGITGTRALWTTPKGGITGTWAAKQPEILLGNMCRLPHPCSSKKHETCVLVNSWEGQPAQGTLVVLQAAEFCANVHGWGQ